MDSINTPQVTAITPSLLSSKHLQKRQKGGKRGKQCKVRKFLPGNLWPTWCRCWTAVAHEAAVAEHPPHCDLQPLTQDRAGRIILMLLVNCSQVTPLEAQLWFYNVQLHCVKWGWCFQETGALVESLCSGSSKVLSLCWIMEVSVLSWVCQTGVAWSWGAPPSLYQSSPSLQTYTCPLWPH